jgi:Polyketide cyclase / dehydrase and lipid transport
MFSHSIDIRASAERIYRCYADHSSWPRWDPAVREVHLPSGLSTGSSGWLLASGGPRTNIRIQEATAARSFTVESQLPGCRMLFAHSLQAGPLGVRATHSLSFAGPLAFLFRRLLGTKIAATLPGALQGLKRMSESDASTQAQL